jgi:ribosomal protein S18 acetylase RimI-like enzyme
MQGVCFCSGTELLTQPSHQSALAPLQILDLRHYGAASLRPILDAEVRIWAEQLQWDYTYSTNLLLQYLDARVLPGFVAAEEGRVLGYAFCVYEDRKAVIGDVFAIGASQYGRTPAQIETTLLSHVFGLLQNSPGVDRIESQLLLHTHNLHGSQFRDAGFAVYSRIFMELDLRPLTFAPGTQTRAKLLERQGIQLRPWQESDFNSAGALIAHAYEGHLDAIINDQYRSVAGSLRFLHNIVRFPGCGFFDPASSFVIVSTTSGVLIGMILCSRVRDDVQHITQVCVAAPARGIGAGTLLLQTAAETLAARGFSTLSLTVTSQNTRAVELYRRVGFVPKHTFDAMAWVRGQAPAQHKQEEAFTPGLQQAES